MIVLIFSTFVHINFSFYNCTLIKDIGDHKIGEQFELITIDFESGELTLWEDESGDEMIDEYTIGIVIKGKIDSD